MPIIPSGGNGGGVNVNIQGISDHEKLGGLLGGDDTGHYHLTKSEYLKIKKIIDGDIPVPPEPESGYDGGFAGTADSEYDRMLDGGYPPNDHIGNIDGGLELLTILDAESGGGDMDGGEII